MTDANVLAEHRVWAATTDAARNQVFNVVNGDVFRWSWLWKQIADWFGVEAVGFDGTMHPLEKETQNDASVWKELAEKNNLKEKDLNRLASSWHTDLDLGRPIEVMTNMSKSRKLGVNVYQATNEAFFNLFNELRLERLIP